MRRFLIFLLGLCLWFGTPLWAEAQSSQPAPSAKDIEQAKALFQEGEKYFYTGDFQKAKEFYQQSYLLSKKPLLLRNMAICEENLERFEEARHLWEAFLRSLPPSDPKRQEAEQSIAELDLILKAKNEEAKALSLSISATQAALPGLEDHLRRSKLKIVFLSSAVGSVLIGGIILTAVLARGEGIPTTSLGDRFVDF